VGRGEIKMPLEDFLLYTEVDPNNHITRTSTLVTHESYRNEDACLYDDKGVDYFGTEFTHYLEITPVTWTDVGLLPPLATCWMVSVDNSPLAGRYLHLRWYEQSNTPRLELLEKGGAFHHSAALSWGTKYYITIVRNATTLKCYIYSDALRSVLVEMQSINLVYTNQKYRYIYACHMYNIGVAYVFEHKVERLFIGVGADYGGSIISLDGGGSFDFNPIYWKETQECKVAIRPVPLRSGGPNVDTGTWVLTTREIIIRVRLSDAEKTALQTIFDTRERVWILMSTGWSYTGWFRGKPVKYEYRVVNGTLRPWLYELRYDIEVMNYNP